MSLVSSIIKFTTNRAAKRFEGATRNAASVQRELLRSMVEKNVDTEYGRKYGFDRIKTVEDYQKQVPVITYEDIADDMVRVTEGARNVFTAEDPVMFAQTSGTTGAPKFIPVTPSSQGGSHSDQMRTWMSHAMNAHPAIFDGKVISLVSPAIEGYAPSGLPYGSTSGHIYKNMPSIMQRAYSISNTSYGIE